MSICSSKLPAVAGSYLLWLYLPRQIRIEVGKLGGQLFRRGWYGYCGSAFGPGGLRGRIDHHLHPVKRPHWHIDYLRVHARPKYLWLLPAADLEHSWPRQLATQMPVSQPVAGFGSSDCRCYSHLVYLPKRALLDELLPRLEGADQLRKF